jgi:hypothetical protein
VGFLRAPAVPAFPTGTRDLSGTVTCIGVETPFQIAVSGTLDTPLVADNVTFPDFTVLINTGVGSTPWIWILPSIVPGPAGGPCGVTLFFLAGLPETYLLPGFHLTRGQLVITGIS